MPSSASDPLRVARRARLHRAGSWLAALTLIANACVSAKAPPTHFGRWGPVTSVREPERSILVSAIAALSSGDAASVVVARYAGDRFRRLDLAPLNGEVPVALDAEGKLGPIDTGMPAYRARVFGFDFPGKTTILELSVPDVHGDSASMAAWRWRGLEWKCELPGYAEQVSLKLVDGHWTVTSVTKEPGGLVLRADCP